MKHLLVSLTCALLSCKSETAAAPSPAEAQKAAPKPGEAWRAVIDAPDRSEADKKLDAGRHPAEMLEFLDPKPGMKVADLGAGGGFTTELLARAVGPSGQVWMQNQPEWAASFLKDGLAERFTHPIMKTVTRVDRPFEDPLPPEAKNLDLIVFNAIYHDVANTQQDRARMNKNIFNALQPGGVYVVIDSSAKAGSGLSATKDLHRIDEQVVRDEVTKAGFKLQSESQFLRNPQDTRDWSPTPRAAGERRGTSDRFALRFVRPEGSAQQAIAPKLRLPAGARPTHITAQLTVNPLEETLTGDETIDLLLDAPQTLLWLSADGLKIQSTEPKAAEIVDAQPGFIGLRFEAPLPQGASKLRLQWTAQVSKTDYDGAFRQQENGEWYVITHLESTGARRIWPCFDEPSFKIPWKISLRVRKGDAAFFNTLPEKEEAQGDLRVVTFAETRPLPSYLLAFGVGPYERVDAGKMKSGAPVGVIVTKGKSAWATYSAKSSPALMSILEDYFGMPYHYSKLDLIEIPLGTGAMENPGLISFNQRINLTKPGEETPQFHRRAASVEAHEFGHLWFGDMVTTAWWDDIWLNEAFATWLESKTVETWQPSWNEPAERAVSTNGRAMGADRLLAARKIRQPIETDSDIKNAFDGITYEKGAAVIGMFEQYLGADAFRRGVQRYLREHADGNATAKEFLAAISAEAGKDVAPAFSTFLDQAGLPLVSAKLSCAAGKGRLELAQSRYLPLGAGQAPEGQAWQIPVCARFGKGKVTDRACTLLTEKTGGLDLPYCPEWLAPNASGSGYYRSAQDDASLEAVRKHVGKLNVPERIFLVNDTAAAGRAGAVEYARVLQLMQPLSQDADYRVVTATTRAVGFMRDLELFPKELLPKYTKYIRSLYEKRAHALGFAQKKGETDDTRLLRQNLVPVEAEQGDDVPLQAEARKTAEQWLKDHKSVPPDLSSPALTTSARRGDQAWFDKLHAAAKAEQDRTERQRILGAMAGFRDPAIAQQAMQLALSSEFDPREAIGLLTGAANNPATRDAALDFADKNFDALVARLPRDAGAGLAGMAGGVCDEERAARAEKIFGERMKKIGGGPRRFAQVMEGVRQCIAFKAKAAPSVTAFLQGL